jgi:predicted metal-dependent phosphoesterase TrpH
MIIDMHVHTSRGSADSNLSPLELVEEARRVGLDGVCLTEHSGPWDKFEYKLFASQHDDLLLVPAMEVESEMGHITVFGLDRYVAGIRDPKQLRRVADNSGAFVVIAHPFRNMFHKIPYNNNLLFKDWPTQPTTAEEAASHPIFAVVDAIEVANAGNTDDENLFAWEVAQVLGKKVVGGSDAHSTNGLGTCVTVFPEPIHTPEAFLEALHAGDFYAAAGLHTGNLQPFPNGRIRTNQTS